MSNRAVELSHVGFRRDDRWILHEINWLVEAGSCAAILGPNGSGKSTLTRIIAGHLWPTAGNVRVLGETFGEVDLHSLRRGLRLVQSTSPVEMDPDLTAQQVVLTGFFGTVGLYDPVVGRMESEALQALDLVGLHRVASHRFTTLSSGERIRCLIARALVVQPWLLLLDEPTAGLDLLAQEQVLATVQTLFQSNQPAPTVILITHHLEELPPATTNLLLLSDGKIAAQGLPEDVLQNDVLSKVYGCPIDITNNSGRFYAHVHPRSWERILNQGAHET